MIETADSVAEMPSPLIDLEAHYGDHSELGGYGVLLKVISPGWEKLFKAISGGKVTHWKRNGIESDLYEFPQAEKDRNFFDFYPNGKELLISDPGNPKDPMVSLFYLRMPGLASGVRVFFPGLYEDSTVKKYAHKVGERSQVLYRRLSPGSIRMRVWLDDWKVGERVVR